MTKELVHFQLESLYMLCGKSFGQVKSFTNDENTVTCPICKLKLKDLK